MMSLLAVASSPGCVGALGPCFSGFFFPIVVSLQHNMMVDITGNP